MLDQVFFTKPIEMFCQTDGAQTQRPKADAIESEKAVT